MAQQRERPYTQFNFLVDLGDGITEGPQAGFQEISGIGMEMTVIEYRNGNAKENAVVKLTGLATGSYRLVATKVGYRANDVQSAWRDPGSPGQLTRAQVQTLRKASAGGPAIEETIKVDKDGTFSRSFEMRQNDVWLVELRPL